MKGKTNVSGSVFEYLQHEILAGTWKPGEKIPTEKMLCEELKVSRVSVRRAIGQLVSMGLLKSVQGSGTFVCPSDSALPLCAMLPAFCLNREDQLSMIEFRRIVEVETAGLCALRATPEEIRKLFQNVEFMEQAKSPKDIVRYDLDFHTLIAQSTRNFAIIRVFEIMQEAYRQILSYHVSAEGNYGAGLHRKIAEAVQNRNPQAAKMYMAEHLQHSAGLYFTHVKNLKESGET